MSATSRTDALRSTTVRGRLRGRVRMFVLVLAAVGGCMPLPPLADDGAYPSDDDGGVSEDGGSPADGGVSVDAGRVVDASVGHDAGFDAGTRFDAGTPRDAGMLRCGARTFECEGRSPDPAQPVVPGTTCCCEWGLEPVGDGSCD